MEILVATSLRDAVDRALAPGPGGGVSSS
jgi:hypothetical protein